MTTRRVRRYVREHRFALCLLMPATVYTVFFSIVIVFTLLQLALTGLDGHGPTLTNFQALLTSRDFWLSLWRTLVFVLVGTPLQLLAGLGLALLVNRRFAGRGLVRSAFLLPIAIPGLVTAAIVKYMLFSYPFGHVNDAILAVRGGLGFESAEPVNWYASPMLSLGLALVAKVWRDMPISMLILLAGLQSIGRDQLDAARTLGASSRQQFWYITFPLLVPAISTVLVLRSIEIWKEFLFPYIIAPSYPVLGVLINTFYHEHRNPPLAAALALLLLLLILGFSALLTRGLRRIEEGLVRT